MRYALPMLRRIEQSRRLLLGLSRTSGVVIEIPLLERLVDIAREHGAAAKSSGAGGGDCGIALCPPATNAAAMRAAWEAAGICPWTCRFTRAPGPPHEPACRTRRAH